MQQEPSASPTRGDRRERVGWYFYDWANSAFATTVATVFLGPYVSNLAREAAGSDGMARFLGIAAAPDSFMPYCISLSVVLQVLFLPILGAIADYSNLRKRLMQIFAVTGSVVTVLMFFCHRGELVAVMRPLPLNACNVHWRLRLSPALRR